MSWNAGHFSLAPGASVRISYWWGDDHGPQFAEGREFNGSTTGNSLRVGDDGTIRNGDGSVTYFVDTINEGPNVATFELIGGGV